MSNFERERKIRYKSPIERRKLTPSEYKKMEKNFNIYHSNKVTDVFPHSTSHQYTLSLKCNSSNLVEIQKFAKNKQIYLKNKYSSAPNQEKNETAIAPKERFENEKFKSMCQVYDKIKKDEGERNKVLKNAFGKSFKMGIKNKHNPKLEKLKSPKKFEQITKEYDTSTSKEEGIKENEYQKIKHHELENIVSEEELLSSVDKTNRVRI